MSDLIKSYKNSSKRLKEEIIDLCYFMNGGIEIDSAWAMSFEDREIAVEVINRRLKESNPKGKEYM